MIKTKNLITILLVILCVVFTSCLNDAPDNFSNPDSAWNPSFSFPVGYTSLKMNEESGFNTSLLNDNDLSGFPDWIDEIDVPLSYSMPFDMQELNNLSETIVRIMFRLNTYNGFPAVTRGQVYFLDIDQIIVDSLFVDGPLTLNPGSVQGNGETINPSYDQNDVVFEQDKVDDLSTVRYVLIEGAIHNLSLDSTLIEYYPDYKLDIQMGVQVELNLNL